MYKFEGNKFQEKQLQLFQGNTYISYTVKTPTCCHDQKKNTVDDHLCKYHCLQEVNSRWNKRLDLIENHVMAFD